MDAAEQEKPVQFTDVPANVLRVMLVGGGAVDFPVVDLNFNMHLFSKIVRADSGFTTDNSWIPIERILFVVRGGQPVVLQFNQQATAPGSDRPQ